MDDLWASMGFGGVAGVAVGYAAKKIGKALAIALGLLFVAIQALSYAGFVTVDWGSMEGAAVAAWGGSGGTGPIDRLWRVVSYNLPFAGAFGTGAVVGFRKG